MPIPAALKNRDEGDDHQRQRHEGEQNVGDEDWKINPRDQSGIARGFLPSVQMIDDVADEKPGRSDQGDDHARRMTLPDVATDPKPAHGNENGADGVQ